MIPAINNSMEGPKRDQVLKLIDEKVRLENELRENHEILNKYHVDMREPLVDNQGYPREDIDVYQVRHARHKIICLQNDLRSIFKQIEKGLAEVHAEDATDNLSARRTATVMSNNNNVYQAVSVPRTPFAVVTMVDNGSPADVAGLCKDDRVIQFGSVTSKNFTCMEDIYKIVLHSVGQPLDVQVLRGSLVVGVTLVPKPWSNRGLLGCHIQKVDIE